MSQGLNTIHTFVLGCPAGPLEVSLAKKIHTFVLGCSPGPLKIHLAGPTLLKVRMGAQIQPGGQIQPGSSHPACARSSQEQPGAARSSWEQLGAARSSQEQPGAAQETPGEQPGAARSSREQPRRAQDHLRCQMCRFVELSLISVPQLGEPNHVGTFEARVQPTAYASGYYSF